MGILDQKTKENDELKKQNEAMQKRLDLLEAKRHCVNKLDLDKVSELKETMQCNVKIVDEIETEMKENIRMCKVCMVTDKCMALNNCEHISMCEQCEDQLTVKRCPICRAGYTNCGNVN